MEFIYHFDNQFATPLKCGRYKIYQVGELLTKKGTVIMDHFQWCHEITFVVSGQGESSTDKCASPIAANDCYISFINEWHKIAAGIDGTLRYRFVGFNSEAPEIVALLNELQTIFNTPQNRTIHCPACSDLFRKLLDEMTPSVYNDMSIDALMTEILITILRTHRKKTSPPSSPEITTKNLFVYRIYFYIENNILKIQKLQDLCDVFHYSYQYITRVFFEVTKTRLHDFFIQTKIKTAKHLLETSGQTVTEIGYILNYSCTHTFTRMFKKYTGITPKQYQLKCSEGKALKPLPETKEDK